MILFVPASSSPVFIRRFSAVSEDALPYYSENTESQRFPSVEGNDRVESKSQQLTSRTRFESWRLAQTVQQLQTSYILAYSLHLIEGELWGKRWKNSKKLTLLKEMGLPLGFIYLWSSQKLIQKSDCEKPTEQSSEDDTPSPRHMNIYKAQMDLCSSLSWRNDQLELTGL